VIVWKEVSWIQLVKISTAGVCNVEPITKKQNALGEKIPLLQRCLSSCQQSELGGKLLHEFYCTVLGIVANVVSLIDSLGGGVRTLSNKKKQYPITKKVWWRCFVQQRKWYESGKTGKRFRYPENDVDYNFENKEKTIFQFFLLEYARKHNTVSGNPKQKTLLTLA